MKKLICFLSLMAIFASCSNYGGGELVGVQGRGSYYEPEPYGMVFVPQGSFHMGPVDQDLSWTQNSMLKTVSIDAFWMDETEMTNNKYRQFVYWVRDSIMRSLLGEQLEDYVNTEDEFGNIIDPPQLNWDVPIDFKNEEVKEILKELYYQKEERFYGRKEIDTRKLMYEYYFVDLEQAGLKRNRYNYENQQYGGNKVYDNGEYKEVEALVQNLDGDIVPVQSRADFIMRDVINVYPDTLCWISDFSYSYNEPMATMYFWHPAYDNYPVIGVNWKQAKAFCVWRTQLLNSALRKEGQYFVHDYRLPFESEWEYAARGGLQHAKYPWGGPYTRNKVGCFVANFKPLRGNYTDDGALATAAVGTYSPNEWGLYDMAGNVAEWTLSAYDESSHIYTHDMNPNYQYNARPDDPPAKKRKVIRGGSWKDVALYLQTGMRSYEYQDTTKSYIGFRCVRAYLGSN